MTIEPFDAVLAETRKIQTIHDFHLDRLAAAHAAEKEAAERDARRAVGLLREYRAAPKFSHDHAAIKRTVALEDEIDAAIDACMGENGDA